MISCDVDDLAEAAKCIQQCLAPGMRGPVTIYLLQQIAGNTQTPRELIEASKCFYGCIPKGIQGAVQSYLLCQIASGGIDPPGSFFRITESGDFRITESGDSRILE